MPLNSLKTHLKTKPKTPFFASYNQKTTIFPVNSLLIREIGLKGPAKIAN